jgi:hypothetical protein
MKKWIKDTLSFLRLIDDDCVLSITNIGCIVVLAKVAMNPNPSIVDMGTLLVTLSLYFSKKHLSQKAKKLTDENKQAISDLTTKINQVADKASGLAMHVGLRTPIVK